jgi:hypothetical protein
MDDQAAWTRRTPWTKGNRLLAVDVERRRIWIGGQRVHHGLTGLLLAAGGLTGLAARKLTTRGGIEWTLLGTALIAHDWGDRAMWFKRGPGD